MNHLRRILELSRRRSVRLVVAAALLTALYIAVDWRAVGRAVASLEPRYLLAALAMFVPQTLVSAIRWQRLVRGIARLSLGTAVAHTLRASAMNLILPSKLGDLTKAAMLEPESLGNAGRAGALAVGEKVGDVAALALLLLCGAAKAPLWAIGAGILVAVVVALALGRWADGTTWPARISTIAAGSLVLWSLHLVQIDLCLRAAGVFVAPEASLARIPVAIFAGLLPLSLWGVGTRDAALVWLFADVATAPTMTAVGALTALRYLIPGACGVVVQLAQGATAATPLPVSPLPLLERGRG